MQNEDRKIIDMLGRANIQCFSSMITELMFTFISAFMVGKHLAGVLWSLFRIGVITIMVIIAIIIMVITWIVQTLFNCKRMVDK